MEGQFGQVEFVCLDLLFIRSSAACHAEADFHFWRILLGPL